jgi:hypothetical protein
MTAALLRGSVSLVLDEYDCRFEFGKPVLRDVAVFFQRFDVDSDVRSGRLRGADSIDIGALRLQPRLLIFFAESLTIGFAVRIEEFLAAGWSACSESTIGLAAMVKISACRALHATSPRRWSTKLIVFAPIRKLRAATSRPRNRAGREVEMNLNLSPSEAQTPNGLYRRHRFPAQLSPGRCSRWRRLFERCCARETFVAFDDHQMQSRLCP